MLGLAALACRTTLEDEDQAVQRTCRILETAPCTDAKSHADLAWLEENVFKPGCIAGSCHDGTGGDQAAKLDLRAGMARAHLVNVPSKLEPDHLLVAAGQPSASYLLMMVQQIRPEDMTPPASPPPADVGFMPQTSPEPLCCQKLDALERWIAMGAPN